MSETNSQYVIDVVLRMSGSSQANKSAFRMAQRMVQQQRRLQRAARAYTVGIRDQERAQRALQARNRQAMAGFNRAARTAASGAYGIRGAGHAIDGGYSQRIGGAARGAAMAGGAGMGAGLYQLQKAGTDVNRLFESGEASVASTLQLFGNADSRGVKSFTDNLAAAKHEFADLFQVAVRSPATLEETVTMYKNMLPGAFSSSHDLGRVMGLQDNALALGALMGGDYATVGSQMSRMFSGGAGAEQETWRAFLSQPIKEIGTGLGYFNKNLKDGADLTAAFNALDKGKRFELIEKALQRLDPVVDHLANTFEGLVSRTEGAGEAVMIALGKPIMEAKKGFMQKLLMETEGPRGKNGKRTKFGGGVLANGTRSMAELTMAGDYVGRLFQAGLGTVFDKIIEGLVYVSENWEKIATKLFDAFDLAWKAGGLFVKYALSRAVMGQGVAAVGSVVGVGMRGLSGMSSMAQAAAQMGASASEIGKACLAALPAMAMFAALMGAAFVAGAAVVAFFIQNWDTFMLSINTGANIIQPILGALDTIWFKLVAAGGAIMGMTDATNSAEGAGRGFTAFLNDLSATFYALLFVAGVVQGSINAVALVFEALYLVLVGFVAGVVKLANMIPFVDADGAEEGLYKHMEAVMKQMTTDAGQVTKNTASNAAEAYLHGAAKSDGPASQWMRDMETRNALAVPMRASERVDEAVSAWAKKEAGKPPKKGNTYINKVVMNNDLRNHDPDRVVGAFWDNLERATSKRTSAYGNIPK